MYGIFDYIYHTCLPNLGTENNQGPFLQNAHMTHAPTAPGVATLDERSW